VNSIILKILIQIIYALVGVVTNKYRDVKRHTTPVPNLRFKNSSCCWRQTNNGGS